MALANTAEKLIGILADAASPLSEAQQAARCCDIGNIAVDTQALTDTANQIIDSDPSHSLAARVVMAQFTTGQIDAVKASHYITKMSEDGQ